MKKINLFLVLFAFSGSLLAQCESWWSKGVNSSTASALNFGVIGMVADENNNLYVNAYFQDTLFYGADTIVHPEPGRLIPSLMKLDNNGDILWHKFPLSVGANSNWYSYNSVKLDLEKNIIVGGTFSNDTLAFDAVNLIATNQESYIVKYDTLGNVLWGFTIDGPGQNSISDIAIDPTNNDIIVAGSYSSQLIIGQDTLQYIANYDTYLARFDKNGVPKWAKSIHGSNFVKGGVITVDENGNTYATGPYYTQNAYIESDTLTYYGTKWNSYLIKFDPDGNHIWVNSFYSASRDHHIYDISAKDGIIYFTGDFGDTLFYNNQQDTIIGGFTQNAYIAAYDTNGITNWINPLSFKSDVIYLALNNNYIYALTNKMSYTLTVGKVYIEKFDLSANSIQNWTVGGVFTGTSAGITAARAIVPSNNKEFIIGGSHKVNFTVFGNDTLNGISPGGNLFMASLSNYQLSTTINVSNDTILTSSATSSSYQWYFNGSIISGATLQNYIATQNGDYYLIISDSNGCSSNSDTVSVIITSTILNKKDIDKITIYPNPFTNYTNIEFNSNIIKNIRIIDVTGRQVLDKNVEGENHFIIQRNHLKNGIYHVIFIDTENKTLHKKIVVN
ncbi:MAG: T9SS type A sorting domain-containing protein [Bacteroidetes bacterium]|nr:T9SS type A sorting domain-containing protein [Bacteroidota bacterium]